MDVVVRGWRPLLIATVLASAVTSAMACGQPEARGPVGVSDRPHGRTPGEEPTDGGLRDGAASLPTDYRTTFTKVNKARLPSSGHASGRWEIDVWANEAGQKALASRSKDVPTGAMVVQEHFERSEGNARGPVMLMEKRAKGFAPEHGDWRWVVVGSGGQLVRDGVIEQCAGCHDDAPMDGLFPIVE